MADTGFYAGILGGVAALVSGAIILWKKLHGSPPVIWGNQEVLDDAHKRGLVGWNRLQPLRNKPRNARKIPVLGTKSSRFAITHRAYYDKLLAMMILRLIKQALVAAGRGDEDPRCHWHLYGTEGGYDMEHLYWCNVGNHKFYNCWGDASTIMGSDPHVFTLDPDACGIMVLWGSHDQDWDGYNCFNSWDAWFRHELAWFLRNGYQGVVDGYKQGGLDGLLTAQTVLGNRGYSGASTAERLRRSREYWQHMQNLCGADWESVR